MLVDAEKVWNGAVGKEITSSGVGIANARLIAAAPELLEALQGLLADIEDYQRINNLGGENNHWQVIARAAIAKATQS